jgi:hypothetical protein
MQRRPANPCTLKNLFYSSFQHKMTAKQDINAGNGVVLEADAAIADPSNLLLSWSRGTIVFPAATNVVYSGCSELVTTIQTGIVSPKAFSISALLPLSLLRSYPREQSIVPQRTKSRTPLSCHVLQILLLVAAPLGRLQVLDGLSRFRLPIQLSMSIYRSIFFCTTIC